MSLIEFFTSSVYRGPLIGSMFMCLTASIVGVFAFLQKRLLISETLSHASFPGVVLGVYVASFFLSPTDSKLSFFYLTFAFVFCLAALLLVSFMEKKIHVKSDTVLCYILSFFFAIGLLIASQMQFVEPYFYKKSLSFLYGQVATMTDTHIWIYGSLFVFTTIILSLFYYPIKAYLFDPLFFQGLNKSSRFIEGVISLLLLLAIVVGFSSVGVILLSGMLIAPCLAARQWTSKLNLIYIISGLIGVVSALFGVIGSTVISSYLNLSFPTGPLIVLTATFISFSSLLFAPEKGLFFRSFRMFIFRAKCIEENLLKGIWQYKISDIKQMKKQHQLSYVFLFFFLKHMEKSGWVYKQNRQILLTVDGEKKAKKIVRCHRLWELYLTDYLGIGVEKVHKSAEQIEHIITEDIERRLTAIMENPKHDPHQKPIPEKQV